MFLNANDGTYETRDNIDEKVIKTYRYGSRVYGCHSDTSDYDFIVIVESDNPYLYYSVNWTGVNYTVYSEQKFISLIQAHQISALECIFQHEEDRYRKYFELDKEKLRRAISSVSSNSYVKCKKKLKQGENYIGLKSMFHSLRILNFGIQIARYGKIVNYSSANVYLKLISNIGADWERINKRFKPVFNMLKSHFKKVAPMEGEVHEK